MQNLFRTTSPLKPVVLLAFFTLLFSFSLVVPAQQAQTDTQELSEPDTSPEETEELDQNVAKAVSLEELSLAIDEKSKQLKALEKSLQRDKENPELQANVKATTEELETLTKSFEQIAIGSTNLDILGIEEETKTWQEELTLVVKPLLENLRSLTERPRKQEDLKRVIDLQRETAAQADNAIASIDELIELEPSKNQLTQLKQVREKWTRSKDDAERQAQLAEYQLNSLNGGSSQWFEKLKSAFSHFVQERGLTLLIALMASMAIWFLFAGIRKIIENRGKSSRKQANRTTYRVIAYTQKLLTIILIVIAIITVFFIRGDILLLVITLAFLFASALGLRSLLPLFIAESRLLLNIGAVREHEQVIIDGVPWRVAAINVYSKFVNPEIQGALRLPLSTLKELTSREVSEEKWFPSSIGDWVLNDDGKLYEVVKQTPVTVELQSAQRRTKLIPTAQYFAAGMENLTKSKQIRITSYFGIGYELQNIALTDVPDTFQTYCQTHLEEYGLGTEQIEVRVEFSKAGESSLDYIIIAVLGAKAAKHYYRVDRIIQKACVAACNDKGWGIPFPQLTVHRGE